MHAKRIRTGGIRRRAEAGRRLYAVGRIIIVLRPQFLSLPRILFLFVFVVAVWLVVKHI